jgi:tetratricopeptide (TPR) repeat protein
MRPAHAAVEDRQEKKMEQVRQDTENISLQQKELKEDLHILESAILNFAKGHEALKQENQKLAQDVASLKNKMPARDAGKHGSPEAEEYYGQGEQFVREGDFTKAIEAFEKSLRSNPHNAEAHYRLGILYQHARDDERKAVYHLKRFLRMTSDPDKKAEARYLLRMFNNDADRTH